MTAVVGYIVCLYIMVSTSGRAERNKETFFFLFQYLSLQQHGMAQLIGTINADMESLKVIKDGMTDLLTGHSVS